MSGSWCPYLVFRERFGGVNVEVERDRPGWVKDGDQEERSLWFHVILKESRLLSVDSFSPVPACTIFSENLPMPTIGGFLGAQARV